MSDQPPVPVELLCHWKVEEGAGVPVAPDAAAVTADPTWGEPDVVAPVRLGPIRYLTITIPAAPEAPLSRGSGSGPSGSHVLVFGTPAPPPPPDPVFVAPEVGLSPTTEEPLFVFPFPPTPLPPIPPVPTFVKVGLYEPPPPPPAPYH